MNPYRDDMLLEGMLQDPRRFIGLSDELESLVAHVTQDRPASVSLVGSRGMGKSFTLRFLADPRGARQMFRHAIGQRFRGDPRLLLFVPIDLSGEPVSDGRLPLMRLLHEALLARLALLLDVPDARLLPLDRLTSLRLADLDALREQLRRALDAAREEADDAELRDRFAQSLGEQLPDALVELLRRAEAWGVRAIFLLDEFDAVARRLSQEDYDHLRAVQSAASLVVASTRALSEQVPVEVQTSPFFNLLHRLTLLSLHFLPPEDARRLITEPPTWHDDTARLHFSVADVEYVIELAGLHPDLILETCAYLYRTRSRTATPDQDVLPPDERPVVRAMLRPLFWDFFAGLWRQVSEADRRTLISIAASRSGATSAPPDLLARGYVVYEDGRYRLFAGLFSDYVLEQARSLPAAPPTSEPTETRAALTDLERRLLDLLRAEDGALIARDAIVAELYADVADAHEARGRLDALVSRLRGKLADEPLLIEAVRGKGYRLVRRF